MTARPPTPARWLLPAVLLAALAACGGDDTPAAERETAAATAEPAGSTEPAATTESTATTAAPVESTELTATTALGATDSDELFPDVLDAQATFDAGSATWKFDVTLSSLYDSPERYADAWRVLGPDGTEYGVRVLTHHHAGEQPFTRSLSGVEIPDTITTVTIEGRDQISGYGGASLSVDLERS